MQVEKENALAKNATYFSISCVMFDVNKQLSTMSDGTKSQVAFGRL